MLFALLVLDETDVVNGSLVFDVAAFVILASIIAHGLTDTVGASWIDRRMRAREESEAAGEVPGGLLD